MNVVLDDAEEVYDCSAKAGKEPKPRRELGELGCEALSASREKRWDGIGLEREGGQARRAAWD
jgi:hypothetical protein